MDSPKLDRLSIIRFYLFFSCLIYLYVFWERISPTYGLGSIFGFSGSMLAKLMPMYIGFAISAGLLLLSVTTQRQRLLYWADWFQARWPREKLVNLLIFILPLLITYPTVQRNWLAKAVDVYLPTWWVFGHLVLLGSLGLYSLRRKAGLLSSLACAVLAYGVVYEIIIYSSTISTYPLRMGWSEASRYYYASLFLAQKIYGVVLPLPTLHASRYMLLAIPFLISGLPLWFHRLWQVLLWLCFTWAGSWAIVRRFKLESRLTGLLLTAWGFLFFFQGPIYYHLMMAAVIVLLGFNSSHPWRSSLFVLLASIWAGLSRINWFPVPGLLAVTLYVLETPLKGRFWLKYWLWPAAWAVLGFAAAFATQEIYIAISMNPPYVFGSSLSSPLLWYRLWPNATYASGILLGLAWCILPVAFILLYKFILQHKAWHWIRSVALGAILGVFGVGGIVVSIKIGGGSNLHNMDAFFVFLVVITGYLYFHRFAPDEPERVLPARVSLAWTTVALIIPLIFLASSKIAVYQVKPDYASQLNTLQHLLDQAHQENEPVLFVVQRQLVTFGMVHNVQMQPDYELVFLMEMAMADNQQYLQTYENELKAHKYAYVIFETTTSQLQDPETEFAEENNAWVVRVSGPLVKYYKMQAVYPALDLSVFEPCEPIGCGGK